MAEKIFKGSVYEITHNTKDKTTSRKYVQGSRGFIKPHGQMRKKLYFETDLNVGPGDWVEYSMDRGEPIILKRIMNKREYQGRD